MIPEKLLAKIRYGGINIHPSLLPKYRGANPWFEAYYNYDLIGGVTIHKLSLVPDGGNIFVQKPFYIQPGDPLNVSMMKADRVAVELLELFFSRRMFLMEGTPQDQSAKSEHNILYEDIRNLEIVRLWHLLRGFPLLIPELFPSLANSFYEVGEYWEEATSNKPHITYDTQGKPAICCKGGYIQLLDPPKQTIDPTHWDAPDY